MAFSEYINFNISFTKYTFTFTSVLLEKIEFKKFLLFFFQMLMNWGEVAEIDEAVGGWDPEEEDITEVLKEHRRMRKQINK